jgi:hypothetical protein
LAKADPGASKGKLEIETETGVEPRTPSGFNKSHHLVRASPHDYHDEKNTCPLQPWRRWIDD